MGGGKIDVGTSVEIDSLYNEYVVGSSYSRLKRGPDGPEILRQKLLDASSFLVDGL